MTVQRFGFEKAKKPAGNAAAELGRDLIDAYRLHSTIRRAAPGGRVEIAPGQYTTNGKAYSNVVITGSGRTQTTLQTEPLTLRGSAVLMHCTFEYLSYKKAYRAVNIEGEGSVVLLQDVAVRPASGDGAVIGKIASALANRADAPDVRVGPGATLWVDAGAIGTVHVDGGTLYYTPSASIDHIRPSNGAVVAPVDGLPGSAPQPRPQANQHTVSPGPSTVSDGSAPPTLPDDSTGKRLKRFGAGRLTGYKERAQELLTTDNLPRPTRESAGQALSRKPRPEAIGPHAHGRPPAGRGPQIVWPSSSGHEWDTGVAPHLQRGVTVLLEAGEYWIPSRAFEDVTIFGMGDPHATVVHLSDSGIEPAPGCTLALSNLTVRPAVGKPALGNIDGRALVLSNVVIDSFRRLSPDQLAPLVILRSGTTTMEHCEIRSNRHDDLGFVQVADGARLEAARSAMGALHSGRGSVRLTDCAAHRVTVENDGVVHLAGTLWTTAPESLDFPTILAIQSGHFTAERVVSESARTVIEAQDESSIEIGRLDMPRSGRATVRRGGVATATVGGDQQRIGYEGGDLSDTIETAEELLAQLESMVGLNPVKTWVRGLVKRLQFDAMDSVTPDKSNYHMVFYGSPGTGKTTVARIIGKLLFRLGVLPTTNYSEVVRSNIIGVHLGETEDNTRQAIDEAMGGVLFVDEAYQLARERSGTTDFGQEAIDTLLTELENRRGDFVAIFAGYTEPMDQFLDANPGLRSRLRTTNRIEFPDYTPDDVGTIAANALEREDWTIDRAYVIAAVAHAYPELPSEEQGNGRTARDYAEAIVEVQKEYAIDHELTGPARRRIGAEVVDRAVRAV